LNITVKSLRALLPKLLRGYALDAIDRSMRGNESVDGMSRADGTRPDDVVRVRQFLQDVVGSDRKDFQPVGLGQS
jgi:hypothetical protein